MWGKKEKRAEKTLQYFVSILKDGEVLERIRDFDTLEEALDFWNEIKEEYKDYIQLLKNQLKEEKDIYIRELYPEDIIYIYIICRLEETELEYLLSLRTLKLVPKAIERVEHKYTRMARRLYEIFCFENLENKTDKNFVEILRLV